MSVVVGYESSGEPETERGHELPQLPPRPAESKPEPEPEPESEPAGELSRQPTFDAASMFVRRQELTGLANDARLCEVNQRRERKEESA